MILQLGFVFLAFLSTFTASIYKKGKRVLSLSLLLYMFILAAFSYTNNDANIYRIYWEGSFNEFYTKDIGFGVLFAVAHFLHLSYPVFRFIVYAGCFLILYYVLTRINGKEFLPALLLYFMYTFFLDNIEMRNFAAYTVFMFSLFFLIRNKKTDFLKFLILFMVALTLHKIVIVYLIPCLIYKVIKFNRQNIIMFFDIMFIILCVLSMNSDILIKILDMLPEAIKEIPGIGRNIVKTNDDGWILNLLETIMFYLAGRFIFKHLIILQRKGIIDINSTQYKLGTALYIILACGCLLVPFYTLSGDYMRVIRNLYFLLAALCIFVRKKDPKKELTIAQHMPLMMLIFINILNILIIYRGNVQFPWIYDTFINNYLFNLGQLKYTFESRFQWWASVRA